MPRDPNAEKYENVVIDTSVRLASVITPGGASDAAIRKAQEEYTLVQTPETLQELKDKAQDPDLDKLVSREAREQPVRPAGSSSLITCRFMWPMKFRVGE